jgi:drug/metabolite transporter (DMT)-like permease
MKNNILATFFSIIAFALFVVMDSIAKYLAGYCSVSQIVWARYFFHIIFMIFFLIFIKEKINLKKDFKTQILRSLFLVLATVTTYYAVKYNDLINFYIIFFSTPLFVSLFSFLFLKERLTKIGLILVILSFGTIVYALEPNNINLSKYLFLPLLAALCFAGYQLFTKVIAKNKEPFVALFYTGILGSIIFSIVAFFNWTPVEHNHVWLVLFLLGFIGFISHYMFAHALQLLDLSYITNFQYSQLIWASLINVYFFNDPIGINKIIGIILIIIIGIIFIETQNKSRIRKP